MCVVLSLVPPMLSVACALVERASLVRCVRSYVAGLESAIAYCVVVYCGLVALFRSHGGSRVRLHAAATGSARRPFLGVGPLSQAKASGRVDVYTQGKQGSDC